MAGSSDHLPAATERLIAEAEACHTEEVRLLERLSGEDQRAAEAKRMLQETEYMLAALERFWSTRNTALKKG
jgi:hypothetical protein